MSSVHTLTGLTDPNTSTGKSLGFAGRTAIASAAGGTASALGGGKFANGAVTGAMTHLLNAEAVSTGLKWLSPNLGTSKQIQLITENDSMGKDLLNFPEVKEAMSTLDTIDGAGPVQWRRSLATEGKLSYVGSFFTDLVVNRTRALVGSMRGLVYRDSTGYMYVTGDDTLSLSSATHLPPRNGVYGASLIKNNLFGWNGLGGNVNLTFNVKLYRPYRHPEK